MKLKFLNKNIEKFGSKTSVTYNCEGTITNHFSFLFQDEKFTNKIEKLFNVKFNNNKIIFKVIGKSNCTLEDKYDGLKGYRIAESKASIKAYKKYSNVCNYIMKSFEYGYKDIENALKKIDNFKNTEKNHLKELDNK